MLCKRFISNELVFQIMLDKKRGKMIKLTWYEVKMGSEIGVLRCIESMRKKMKDAYGYKGHTWEDNIQGACGELAFAKFKGIYWDGSVNKMGHPDFIINGNPVEIKTTNKNNGLIVRPDTPVKYCFVLVKGKIPNFNIVGWISGKDARSLGKFTDNGNGRPPAYFVPEDRLNKFK
jgi:hypothetical protein